MIEKLNNNVDRYLRLHLQRQSAVRKAHEGHRKLMKLCRKRQTDAACAFLREHILTAGNEMNEFLKDHRNERASTA
jgi:DNA-binding GntR family transcriptional regulator